MTDTSSGTVAPEALAMFVEDVLEVPARVWHAVFSELMVYDDTEELTRIDAPTLLIWGDGDGLVRREMQEVLRAKVPDTELIVYSGVGHAPPVG